MRHAFTSLLKWIRRRRTQLGLDEAVKHGPVMLDKLGATLRGAGDLFAETSPLKEEDFTLIGKFIQIYCYSDLNARRIIDTLHFARTGREEQFASKLIEKDVLLHLGRCAEPWVPEHIGDGIRKAATTLEMHRTMRHSFAHWAMRRAGEGKGYVILTMQVSEVKKRGLEPHGCSELKWGLMPRQHVLEETDKLNGHGEYLAALAAHLYATRVDLRQLYLAKIHENAESQSQ